MLLAGLKFAPGLVIGVSVFSGMLCFIVVGAELFIHWRKKRRRHLYRAKTRALKHVMPQIRESAVSCFRLRIDDWLRMRDETKYQQGMGGLLDGVSLLHHALLLDDRTELIGES